MKKVLILGICSGSPVPEPIELISQPDGQVLKWSDLLDEKRELWPIRYLLPGGAYVH